MIDYEKFEEDVRYGCYLESIKEDPEGLYWYEYFYFNCISFWYPYKCYKLFDVEEADDKELNKLQEEENDNS